MVNDSTKTLFNLKETHSILEKYGVSFILSSFYSYILWNFWWWHSKWNQETIFFACDKTNMEKHTHTHPD